MKKLLALLLCLALCLPGLCASAETPEPETFSSGDYQYRVLEDGTAEITRYKGKEENLSIPETLDGLPVTGIGDYAFSYCTGLTSVTIPNSVTAIGDEAFYRCEWLTSVTIPDSVVTIGNNPFCYCSSLASIRVSPDQPAFAVIDGVLFGKEDKRLICYPEGLSASSYEIPKGIVAIGDEAFYECRSLNAIIIPDSVTSIGDGAFYGCGNLTSIVVGCDSYAAEYCQENDLPYTYPDANAWLNG